MDRTYKYKFRPGCENLEGRLSLSQLPSQLLSGPGNGLTLLSAKLFQHHS